MTIYDITNVCTGIIESVTMFMLYETFFIKRANIPKCIYGIGVVLLAVMINISNIYFNYGIWNVAGMITSFFVISLLYKGSFLLKIILSVLNYLLIIITEIIVLFSITMIYSITVTEAIDSQSYRLLGTIISKILVLLIANILRVKFKKRNLHIGSSYWILFLIMFLSSTATVFLIFKLSFNVLDEKIYNFSVLCSFGILFSTFFALYLYERLAKQSEIIRNQQQYEQHLKLQLKHLDEILITQNQIKKFKHDFLNYTIGLQSYIDKCDYAGANNYMKKLKEIFNPGKSILETGNTALDAIIITKKAIAENKNIEFDTKIQIPKHINIDPIDICIIFGNALDNAIEACERVKDRKRKISLTIMCQNEAVFCRIINTSSRPEKIPLKTSKADKKNHGFGLENIKTALAKYNSEPAILRSDNEFTLKFVIFIKS